MLSLHEPRFTGEDEEHVLATLRSSWVSTGGPYVDTFERDFASFVGSEHAISVSNGTIALQLSLEVLKQQKGIRSGFDVFVPTLSFIATSNAVFHAGGTPILVDCAPGYMNIDPVKVESIIDRNYQINRRGELINRLSGHRLLAIMPAHIMGWCCDMINLSKIANRFLLPIIEDAAEALGSRYLDGSHVGSTSLAAGYSFNGNKILTTGGGGMLVTNDQEFARLAKHLSTTAKTDHLRYVHDQVGYNFRMVNILAALGVSQMKRMADTLAKKTKIAADYAELSEKHHFKIHSEPYNRSNNWIINAIFPSEAERETALENLLKRKIQARPLWTPAHRLDFIGAECRPSDEFPNADRTWKTALSLPSSPHLSRDEIRLVVDTIGGCK